MLGSKLWRLETTTPGDITLIENASMAVEHTNNNNTTRDGSEDSRGGGRINVMTTFVKAAGEVLF